MSSEHEEVKKDCLEIIDNHIALAKKLVRNKVEELSYE